MQFCRQNLRQTGFNHVKPFRAEEKRLSPSMIKTLPTKSHVIHIFHNVWLVQLLILFFAFVNLGNHQQCFSIANCPAAFFVLLSLVIAIKHRYWQTQNWQTQNWQTSKWASVRRHQRPCTLYSRSNLVLSYSVSTLGHIFDWLKVEILTSKWWRQSMTFANLVQNQNMW